MKKAPLAAVVAAALMMPAYAVEEMADSPSLPPAGSESESISAPEAAAPVEETAPVEPLPGSVARAQFTTEVVDREPVSAITEIGNDVETVTFFTDLRDMEGQTVTHVWEHRGEVVAEVPFEVGGPRWRVWSSKDMLPDWIGVWTVSVVNAAGELLEQDRLEYIQAEAPAPAGAVEPAMGEAGDDIGHHGRMDERETGAGTAPRGGLVDRESRMDGAQGMDHPEEMNHRTDMDHSKGMDHQSGMDPQAGAGHTPRTPVRPMSADR